MAPKAEKDAQEFGNLSFKKYKILGGGEVTEPMKERKGRHEKIVYQKTAQEEWFSEARWRKFREVRSRGQWEKIGWGKSKDGVGELKKK